MSDEKKYSLRDMVLAQREAFVDGACYATDASRRCDEWLNETAARKFPLPRVTRPRVVTDPHNHEPHWGKPREWSNRGGVLMSRTIGRRPGYAEPTLFPWTQFAQVPPTPQRVAVWADLLANPTEEVDDDGQS